MTVQKKLGLRDSIKPARASDELKRLPDELLLLDSVAHYEVRMSEELSKRKEELIKEIRLERP